MPLNPEMVGLRFPMFELSGNFAHVAPAGYGYAPGAGWSHGIMCNGNVQKLRISINHLAVRSLRFAIFVGSAVGWAIPATAAPSGGGSTQAPLISFNIASQPLESALAAFGNTTGEEVLYRTSLTAGRRSAKVQGLFTAKVALDTLLTGTGLIARYTTDNSFTITRQPVALRPKGDPAPSMSSELAKYGYFLGPAQAGILHAICSNPETRPGNYKISLKIWIGPSGAISDIALLASTGDSARDATIIGALQGQRVGPPPPAGMPQPIVMVIAPRSPDETGDCAPADGAEANP